MAWTKERLITLAQQAAAQAGIDPAMFVGQLAQESGDFDPAVVAGKRKSSAGAIGVAQFMPATAKEFGIDPTDPAQAIPAAARYMAQLTKQFGSEALARQAYNWGMGNLRKHLANPKANPLPKETAEYNTRVAARAGRSDDLEIPVLGKTPRSQVMDIMARGKAPQPAAPAAGSPGLFTSMAPMPQETQGLFAGMGAAEAPPPMSSMDDIMAQANEAAGPLFPKPVDFPDRFDGMIRQLLRSV
jgi:hypothetical protein